MMVPDIASVMHDQGIDNLRTALGIVPPSHDDLEALLDTWDVEDSQGNPEEQRRSLNLLIHLLDVDRP